MMTNTKKPRILIISNNALSETNNNGKTLASFFDKYPIEKVRQLYFNLGIPTSPADSFFQITDKDMLKAFFNRKIAPGRIQEVLSTQEGKTLSSIGFRANHLMRIFREIVWYNANWKSKKLDNWLDEFVPEVIFFVAGDSEFVYDIASIIKEKYSTKLITYITDDYILPRNTLNPLWWIRRNRIFDKISKVIGKTDLFLTISPKMKSVYDSLFNKNSIVVSNITESLWMDDESDESNEKYKFIYAGGLHLNRDKVLIKFVKAIYRYNSLNKDKKQIQLDIYSNQILSKRMLKQLNVPQTSKFCGPANSAELKLVLNDADFLLFVESFDKKSIESTRLSLSTKIPEYLSLNKPIFAIGPKNISSMEYLSLVAFCINDMGDIDRKLDYFINDINKKDLSEKAQELYFKNHDNEKILQKLQERIISL